MHQAYRFAIGYFALFALMMLFSGAWLFYCKIGFTPEQVSLYYFGDATRPGKSSYGLLESAVPHLGAMGMFIMVTAHFLLFATPRAKRLAVRLSIALFAAALLDIASGSMIAWGWSAWSWIKLGAFFTLMVLSLWLTLLVLYFAFWHSWSPQQRRR